jgi:hypothetical protein
MGIFYLYEGELEMAAEELELCLLHEQNPSASLLYTLGEVYSLLDRTGESLHMARRALAKMLQVSAI